MELLQEPFAIVMAVLAVTTGVLGWLLFDLRRKWNELFAEESKNAADAATQALQRIIRTENYLAKMEPRVQALEKIAKISIQKVGFLRFNPFDRTGGDQSFTLALLDHSDSGIILSSLYMREGVRVYAKEVLKGVSRQPLSDEETEVLRQAREGNHAHDNRNQREN